MNVQTLTPREELADLLPQIRKTARIVGQRCGLSGDECEDLAGDVCLSLIENDYAKLRSFQGRCSFEGFLRTLVTNEARDLLRHRHGKLRPSATARRLGPGASRFEELRRNRGLSFVEASRQLEIEGHQVDLRCLEELEASLGRRNGLRSFESLSALEKMPATELDPEHHALAHERIERHRHLLRVLDRALAELTPSDQLLLLLYKERTAKELALMFGFESDRKVYGRHQELCRHLERTLLAQGVGADRVELRELLDDWADDEEIRRLGPSPSQGSAT